MDFLKYFRLVKIQKFKSLGSESTISVNFPGYRLISMGIPPHFTVSRLINVVIAHASAIKEAVKGYWYMYLNITVKYRCASV